MDSPVASSAQFQYLHISARGDTINSILQGLLSYGTAPVYPHSWVRESCQIDKR